MYSKTVNLPQTGFDMRANSVVREPQLQQFWEEQRVYEKLSRENQGVSWARGWVSVWWGLCGVYGGGRVMRGAVAAGERDGW